MLNGPQTRLLRLIQTPSELKTFVSVYLTIILASLPAAFLYNLYGALLRAIGRANAALMVLAAAVTVNVALDYCFVARSQLGIAGAAWLGAALVLLIVMAVSRRIKDIMVILILGMMFGSGVSSVVEILQYLSSEAALKSFVIWTMGSLGDVTGGNLALMLPVITAGLVLSVAVIKPLNLLLLGENYARTMGLNVQRTRTLLFLSTVLLAGTVTAFCGPVGFIGLAVPHLARMLFASADHRILMPGSMLAGAALLLVCDLVAKSLALPINTITALMGIPVVIVVVVRNRNIF